LTGTIGKRNMETSDCKPLPFPHGIRGILEREPSSTRFLRFDKLRRIIPQSLNFKPEGYFLLAECFYRGDGTEKSLKYASLHIKLSQKWSKELNKDCTEVDALAKEIEKEIEASLAAEQALTEVQPPPATYCPRSTPRSPQSDGLSAGAQSDREELPEASGSPKTFRSISQS
jgi:hypothetical protein